MGVVMEAYDQQASRMVAIKLVPSGSPRNAVRFAREGEILSRLSHQSISRVLDFGVDAGHFFIVMERLHGRNAQMALKDGPLSITGVVHIMREVLEALTYIHAHGVIHRDLKPSNVILLDERHHSSRIALIDFGISQPDGGGRLTTKGSVAGTPSCVAPEYLDAPEERSSVIDERVDVYGAGLLFYTLLSRRNPFARDSAREAFEAILTSTVPPLGTAYDRAIAMAMHRDRDRRFKTIAAFSNALAL